VRSRRSVADLSPDARGFALLVGRHVEVLANQVGPDRMETNASAVAAWEPTGPGRKIGQPRRIDSAYRRRSGPSGAAIEVHEVHGSV